MKKLTIFFLLIGLACLAIGWILPDNNNPKSISGLAYEFAAMFLCVGIMLSAGVFTDWHTGRAENKKK